MSSFLDKFWGFLGFPRKEEKSEHRHHHHRHKHEHEHHKPELENEDEQEQVSLTTAQKTARKQMEFYFSEPNVQRDTYMKQRIDEGEDRYCPISDFLRFQIIKDLGITEEELVQALSTSRKLELNPEKTHVRSIKPFKNDPRIDYKTISIGGLDLDETRESLHNLLTEQFGRVDYLLLRSIKDKQTQKKKFGGKIDVQLKSEEAAKRAQEKGFNYHGQNLPVKIIGEMKDEGETPKKEKSSSKRTPRSAKPKARE